MFRPAPAGVAAPLALGARARLPHHHTDRLAIWARARAVDRHIVVRFRPSSPSPPADRRRGLTFLPVISDDDLLCIAADRFDQHRCHRQYKSARHALETHHHRQKSTGSLQPAADHAHRHIQPRHLQHTAARNPYNAATRYINWGRI